MRRLLFVGALLLAAACGPDVPLDGLSSVSRQGQVRRCNGAAALCDRPLDGVTLPAAHNAMSSAAARWQWPNQTHGLTRQLEDGVRGLLLDTHYWHAHSHATDALAPDVPVLQQLFLCHQSCNRGAQPLVEGLTEIARFLDTHPDEVAVIVFEDYIAVPHLAEALDASGLRAHVMPDPRPPYPTLAQLIDSGRRLMLLSEHVTDGPAWYPHAWSLMEDTPFNVVLPRRFGCAHNRGPVGAPLYLLNHWLSPPYRGRAAAANSHAVLGAHAGACRTAAGRQPTLVAVDFYDVGALFDEVRALNGVDDAT
jgi:hypothetical protein